MLSYRHAFHAGNHADVLKHFVFVELLDYFNRKDKPYWVVDTHAGAGLYELDRGYAAKNAEWREGIGSLWERKDLPAPLARYVDLVRGLNTSGRLLRYPGSPLIALALMRPEDRLRLFELHGSDIEILARALAKSFPGDEKRYALRLADGFLELKSVLPPPPRRGLVLMDPAYEDKRDYLRTVMAVKEGLARFATGTFAVWYPQLSRGDARQLPEKLRKLPAAHWLDVRLTVRAPSEDGFGMHGSGMLVLNPPFTLADTLRQALPVLAEALGQDGQGSWSVEAGEKGDDQVVRRPAVAGKSRQPLQEARPPRPEAKPPRQPATTPRQPAQRPRRNSRSSSAKDS